MFLFPFGDQAFLALDECIHLVHLKALKDEPFRNIGVPKAVDLCVCEDDTKGDVSEAIVHPPAQSVSFACSSFAKESTGGVNWKGVGNHDEFSDVAKHRVKCFLDLKHRAFGKLVFSSGFTLFVFFFLFFGFFGILVVRLVIAVVFLFEKLVDRFLIGFVVGFHRETA